MSHVQVSVFVLVGLALVTGGCGGGGGAAPVGGGGGDDAPLVAGTVTSVAPRGLWARVPTVVSVYGERFDEVEGDVQVELRTPHTSFLTPGTRRPDGRVTCTTPVMALSAVVDAQVVVWFGEEAFVWDGRVTLRPPLLYSVHPNPVPAGLGAQPVQVRGGGLGVPDEAVTVTVVADAGTPFEAGTASELTADSRVASADRFTFLCPATHVSSPASARLRLVYLDGTDVTTSTSVLTTDREVRFSTPAAADDEAIGCSVAVCGDTAIAGAHGDDAARAFPGAAYTFVRRGTTWALHQKLTASDGAADDDFGISVAIEGDTALVGACRHAGDAGAVYVFVRSGSTWVQQQKLTATDASPGAQFGWSVAVSGNAALIGARLDPGSVPAPGAAYVFTRSGSTWTQRQKLRPADVSNGSFFGDAVALEGDTAAVWASAQGHAGGPSYTYVYERSGATWVQQQKLVPAAPLYGSPSSLDLSGDTLSSGMYVFVRAGSAWTLQGTLSGWTVPLNGHAVSLFGDTVVFGVPMDSEFSQWAGAGFAFERQGSEWAFHRKLWSNHRRSHEGVGNGVALSNDTLLLGGPAPNCTGCTEGRVYAWMDLPAKLGGVGAGAALGASAALDGEWLAVGAPGAGEVHLRRDRSGAWVSAPRLRPAAGGRAAAFGTAVALAGDVLVVGAPLDDEAGVDAGAARVYVRAPGADALVWDEVAQLGGAGAGDEFGRAVAAGSDVVFVGAPGADLVSVYAWDEAAVTETTTLAPPAALAGAEFGCAVAADGERVVVGAWQEDAAAGAVYVFTRVGDDWGVPVRLQADDAESGDRFGVAVAIQGETVVVGAYDEDTQGADAGAAYVYSYDATGDTWEQTRKLVAPGGTTADRFGQSVAIRGDVISVGAPEYDDWASGVSDVGAAYLFRRTGGTWAHCHTWIPWDGQGGDRFGTAVAVSETYVAAGASGDDDEATNAGATYVQRPR